MTFLAASLLSFALASQGTPAAPGTAPVPLLQRIVVLGASVSDGFGLESQVGARTGMTDVVHSAIVAPHGTVKATTSLLFFTSPDQIGASLVAKVREADPTLVFAIDYLFWFAYGAAATDEARLEHLDRGLASLEALDCPLLLGDIPDMSAAARPDPAGQVPPLLVPEQVPSEKSLALLNGRIRSWAAGRKHVLVVPVADFIARLHAGTEIEIHGNRWSAGAREKLIGPDRLHPTLEGAVALWLAGLDALAAARDDLPSTAIDWSVPSVSARVFASKEKEREAKLERTLEKLRKADEAKAKPKSAGGG
jgi:hypothetical protein